jgi:hypothetical protein
MLSAAFLLYLMLVGFFARLRAEPQHPIPMHDQAELTTTVTTAFHVSFPRKRGIRVTKPSDPA